ncbi:MAG: nucleoside phosphorylase [Microscillaceae bacterium]|nr:nucleoside phosphorylase [Microscillaceae bacterium]MDW8461261.1 nucleoside phosphorylase [Cytophagales bacterium]
MPTQQIASSELVITPQNRIYHLGLAPEEIADTIITVGDQTRVSQISKYLDSIEIQKQNREFVTHTGYLGNKRLTILSSGIGIDNVEILMTELDALVNIDFETRTPKSTLQTLKIIRIGTSGSIRAEVEIDSFLASKQSVGLDNVLDFYHLPQTESDLALTKALQETLNLPLQPYCTSCDEDLRQALAFDIPQGNAIAAPGFYAPQGRELRTPLKRQNYLEKLMQFHWNGFYFTNFEMESSAYYAFGQLLGHKVLSVNAIIANRKQQRFSTNPTQSVEKLIQVLLPRIAQL